MNELETARFARQIGFGLAPDDKTPTDALAWAQAQLDQAPKVAFLANRSGGLISDLPADVALLDTQEQVAITLQRHIETRRAMLAASGQMPRQQWDAMRFAQVAYPFLLLPPWQEGLARGCMAVNGPAPVFERFWHFWTNHFTVAPSVNNLSDTAVGPYMRMLRKHMTGNFRDMLFEAVTHPAMILYLDNNKNTGANSVARRSGATTDEINENLGRELLELFTLSTAAGYTQQDVDAVTHILTGWTIQLPDRSHRPGVPLGSHFNYARHEPGTQTVLGKSYSAVVRNDGKLNELVDYLAVHPLTAQHLCTKLATSFVSDTPPADCVARLVAVFTSSKGHLPALHKAVVKEVAAASPTLRKFVDPQTWVWTAHRVSGATLPVVPPRRGVTGERIHAALDELGQAIHDCPQPNGWSLQSLDWISREMLERRVRYAYNLSIRMTQPMELLPQVLARQHGPDSAVARQLQQAKAQGLDAKDLWTAYLTSPEFLWSQA